MNPHLGGNRELLLQEVGFSKKRSTAPETRCRENLPRARISGFSPLRMARTPEEAPGGKP
jgi:hypothetical protein